MTQEQINQLLSFAASEISRHQSGLTIVGGYGVSVSGSGLEQTVSVQVPRLEDDPATAPWPIYVFITVDYTDTGMDDDGNAFAQSGAFPRAVVAILGSDGLTSPRLDSTITIFGYVRSDLKNVSGYFRRDIRTVFDYRIFDPAYLATLSSGDDPDFDLGSRSGPIEVTLNQIIAAIDSPRQGEVVLTETLTLRGEPVHYTPHRLEERQWYALDFADMQRVS